jgi:hypothetical protein
MKINLVLFFCCAIAQCSFTQTVIVTPNRFAYAGWEESEVLAGSPNVVNTTSAFIEITCNPIMNGPYQRGAGHITLPSSTTTDLRRTRYRSNAHHGTYLRDISGQLNNNGKLSFSTYIVRNINQSAPVMVLQVDNDLDDIPDINIAFNPARQNALNQQGTGLPNQPKVLNNTWQEWNASMGWWAYGEKSFTTSAEPDSAIHIANQTIYFTLAEYIAVYPHARIANSVTGDHKGGGIRFTVGISDPDHVDFDGYIDLFTIKEAHKSKAIVYDFKFPGQCPGN